MTENYGGRALDTQEQIGLIKTVARLQQTSQMLYQRVKQMDGDIRLLHDHRKDMEIVGKDLEELKGLLETMKKEIDSWRFYKRVTLSILSGIGLLFFVFSEQLIQILVQHISK